MTDLRYAVCVVCARKPEVWVWSEDNGEQLPYCGICEPEEAL